MSESLISTYVLFRGTAKQTRWLENDAGLATFEPNLETTFDVSESFGAWIYGEPDILHDNNTSCSISFELGTEQFVSARLRVDGSIVASPCGLHEADVIYFRRTGGDFTLDNVKVCGLNQNELWSSSKLDNVLEDPKCVAEYRWFWDIHPVASQKLRWAESNKKHARMDDTAEAEPSSNK